MNLSNHNYRPKRLINVFNELEAGGRCMNILSLGLAEGLRKLNLNIVMKEA